MSDTENGHIDKYQMQKKKFIISHIAFLEKSLSSVLYNGKG